MSATTGVADRNQADSAQPTRIESIGSVRREILKLELKRPPELIRVWKLCR